MPLIARRKILDMFNFLVTKKKRFVVWSATLDGRGVVFSRQEPEKL